MSLTAFFLIAASAAFHAVWNLLAKKNRMSVPYYTIICTTSMLIWLNVQFWTPVKLFELPLSFWLFTAGSVVSDLLYCLGLLQSYKRMEMATVYPIMRSLPIILTAVFTTILGWGDPLSPSAVIGFLIVFAGAMLMPLNRVSDIRLSNYWNSAMFFVLLTAMGTTGYTVFDSRAMNVIAETLPEVSKTVRSLTYYSTRGLVLSTELWTCTFLFKGNRTALIGIWKERNYTPVLAGAFASLTYVLVLLAMNYVTNVSYVQVFRQMGLPFGMFLGIVFLKERSAGIKWIGVSLILAGLAISALL